MVPAAPLPTPDLTISLAPIRVVTAKLLNIENNDYDFAAKVTNPNTDYGSADVEYAVKFLDASGNQISQKTASFYILPGQTKYVLITPLKFSQPISQAVMEIVSVAWQKLDPLAAGGVNLTSRNVSYNQISEPGVFGKAGGSIQNIANFDLGQVDVLVLLFNQGDDLTAVNRTEIRTFLANTSRGFEVSWYRPFVGQVNRVEVEAHTNVFENSNFLRQYERQERFQQFY